MAAKDIRVIGADPTYDLQALTQWVEAREQVMAPVEAIAGGEDAQGKELTAVSFDLNKNTLQSKFAEVKLLVGDKAPVGPNETLVCKGKAYISGNLTGVYLVRPK